MSKGLELLATWAERLQGCTTAADTETCLCLGLQALTGAQAVGFYRFDQTGTQLVPTALVQGGATCPCTGQSVAYENPEDPLCHAIRQNKPYATTFSPALAMPSLVGVAAAVAKENQTGTQTAHCLACPVHFAGQHFFGGVVLGFAGPCALGHGATILLLQAALLLALLETRKAQGSLEQTVHEQAASLEKHQPPTLEGASLGIIGNSQPLREAVRLAHTAAASSVTVLITGETGTGKELFASAIHMLSSRKNKPFVTLNCAAIPDALLESELFGHEQGAFSGATASHQGLLRSAAGGTILLDEIGDMPLPLQAKLLRFLQDKRVRPVGSDVEHSVDLRIIAATNANLEAAVANGAFRKDLYHRLAVFPIGLPPLRERREDILPLTNHFLQSYSVKYQKPHPRLATAEAQRLLAGNYPGNVRELAAILERSFMLWHPASPFCLQAGHPQKGDTKKLIEAVQAFEKELIATALAASTGSTQAAAEALGIPRRTLAHKLQLYGLAATSPQPMAPAQE